MQKARNVLAALSAKGFIEAPGRDHRVFFLFQDGKKTSIYTKLSHGKSDSHDGLCSQMAKQMRIPIGRFNQFVDCTLTGEGYKQLLLEAGILVLPPAPR